MLVALAFMVDFHGSGAPVHIFFGVVFSESDTSLSVRRARHCVESICGVGNPFEAKGGFSKKQRGASCVCHQLSSKTH